MAATAIRMGTAFNGQCGNIAKIIRPFGRTARGAAITTGQNPNPRRQPAFNIFQRLFLLFRSLHFVVHSNS
jgi:hypothetical protein